MACRTDGNGAEGLSMLLVKREFGGITTQKMDVTGWWASGTTYITFEDTKVPVEYVVGQAGNGFRQMMVASCICTTRSCDDTDCFGLHMMYACRQT